MGYWLRSVPTVVLESKTTPLSKLLLWQDETAAAYCRRGTIDRTLIRDPILSLHPRTEKQTIFQAVVEGPLASWIVRIASNLSKCSHLACRAAAAKRRKCRRAGWRKWSMLSLLVIASRCRGRLRYSFAPEGAFSHLWSSALR